MKPIRKLTGVMGEATKILMYEGFSVTALGQIRNANIEIRNKSESPKFE
jgi:hypothetical protein